MVVRFVPAEEPDVPRPDRIDSDLAEVIDFRSRLKEIPRKSAFDEGSESASLVETASDTKISKPAAIRILRSVQSGTGENTDTGIIAGTAATGEGLRQESSQRNTEGSQQTAYEDAVKVLARRALSSGELARELQKIEHSALDIEIVIDEFRSRLYLDDASLARTLAEKLRQQKGASRSHIRQKLRERLISEEVMQITLEELDESQELDLLREAAFDRARKLGGLERATAERRLVGFLARRGWSGQLVYQVVREALDGDKPSSVVRFD